MKVTAVTVIAASTFQIFSAVNDFHTAMPQPVEMKVKEDIRLTRTRETLKILNGDVTLAENLYIAATANNIDPVLFTVLIKTESDFKVKCKSSKGYVGLGQTPAAIQKYGYELVDLTFASCILKDKLRMEYSNGDMLKALQLYKGGKNNEAMKYAKNVMKIYNEIKPQLTKRS